MIYGDGTQSRDFTYVANVVQANLLACERDEAVGQVMNVACGERYSLLDLHATLLQVIQVKITPIFAEARKGDVKHSLAAIVLAHDKLATYHELGGLRGSKKRYSGTRIARLQARRKFGQWLNKMIKRVRLMFRGYKQAVLHDQSFRRVLSHSGWVLSANTVTLVLSFAQGILVARVLGVEQYGILALITTYTTTINQFVDSRVWETATKFVIQYKETGELPRASAVVKLCYLVDALTGGFSFHYFGVDV